MKLTIALAGDQTFAKKPFFRKRKKFSYFMTIPEPILVVFSLELPSGSTCQCFKNV